VHCFFELAMNFAKWQTNFVHTKVVLNIISNNLLSLRKMFALLSLWLVDNLHKISPFWVYAISKQIAYLKYTFHSIQIPNMHQAHTTNLYQAHSSCFSH